jgi:hypothetical protein
MGMPILLAKRAVTAAPNSMVKPLNLNKCKISSKFVIVLPCRMDFGHPLANSFDNFMAKQAKANAHCEDAKKEHINWRGLILADTHAPINGQNGCQWGNGIAGNLTDGNWQNEINKIRLIDLLIFRDFNNLILIFFGWKNDS